MTDVFGFLTIAQWLALLRIALGLWWLESVRHKDMRNFLAVEMIRWSILLAEHHPVPVYGTSIKRLLLTTRRWFPYLIVLGEAAVGLGLTLGFLTPLAAVASIFMNLNYLALAGVKPTDVSVNPTYEVEQGQNLMMLAIGVVVLFTGAGCTWSIDALLGLFCGN
jgi:thiosulfate dehydrogenase [quinone] large subunit